MMRSMGGTSVCSSKARRRVPLPEGCQVSSFEFQVSNISVRLYAWCQSKKDVLAKAFDRLNLQALQVFHLHALARETADGV